MWFESRLSGIELELELQNGNNSIPGGKIKMFDNAERIGS